MLADWVSRYHCHPFRNPYSADERDLLTVELLGDPDTRLYAVMNGGIGLSVWSSLKTASLVASALGVNLELPKSETTDNRPKASKAELDTARAALARSSAVAHLPE